MRITLLARDFPPAVGGIGDHTDLLAAELARRGETVTVVCSPPGEQRDSFDVRPVVGSWQGSFGTIVRAVDATEPDAIVFQYNPFAIGRRGFAPGIGRLARALAKRAPLIVLAHELWFPRGRGGLKGLAWSLSHRLQARVLFRAASAIVVTTERRAGELRRALQAEASKISVVPIGANIEPGARATDKTATRAALGIPPAAFVVAHLGSVGPGRELGPVNEAIASMRGGGIDARLLLAGNTGPVPAGEAILTPGIQTREQLSDTLASADAYVHPDLVGPAAGRRGSLVAALAHGLPVLAYRGPDHAPQLIDGTNVVLVEPRAAAVEQALRELATDTARARRIGEAARRTYEESFAWRHTGDGVLRAIKEAGR